MICGAVCISHTPLLDRSRAEPTVEAEFGRGLREAQKAIEAWAPDFAVLFFPDHFNGFFYDLMPQFCIGMRASSIGDFGTAPGKLSIGEDLAMSCAQSSLRAGIDVAVSYRMSVDHGAAQPLELLTSERPLANVVPIFINCAAPPRTSFARVRALGEAVGNWAAALDQRVVFIASGGLSHDPPLPSIANATPDIEQRLIDGRSLNHAGRMQRQTRIFSQVPSYVSGTSPLRALNPDWDRAFLNDVLAGKLDLADDWEDEKITATAGCGAHEVRTWVAALAAAKADGVPYNGSLIFYNPIKEWLTGTAIAVASRAA